MVSDFWCPLFKQKKTAFLSSSAILPGGLERSLIYFASSHNMHIIKRFIMVM